jgi:exodeoxyribonuclease-5
MIQDFYSSAIKDAFGYTPTPQQSVAIDKLGAFLSVNSDRPAFLLTGYAGTGKTTLVAALVQACVDMEMPFVLMAPTGRAAKVLSMYAGFDAATIHRTIYRQSSPELGARFELGYNKMRNTLFVVDEASMLASDGDKQFGSGSLLEDTIKYVYGGAPGCKLLLLGDDAQLPPVMQQESPALSVDRLKSMGLTVTEHALTEVVRQEAQSGILWNATQIRNSLHQPQNLFLKEEADVKRVDGSNFIASLEHSYQTVGMDETLIITRSNKKAFLYANGIRSRVLYREEKLENSDWLMVVKNNYSYGQDYGIELIANGDMAEVVRLRRSHSLYDMTFVEATIRLVDYGAEIDVLLLEDSLLCESPQDLAQLQKKLFLAIEEDYAHIRNKRERYKKMRQDEHLNALLVRMAYAVTCHKAQGGQWKHVYVDMGPIAKENTDKVFMRWLYTAFTRATEKLYLVQFSDDFFKKS